MAAINEKAPLINEEVVSLNNIGTTPLGNYGDAPPLSDDEKAQMGNQPRRVSHQMAEAIGRSFSTAFFLIMACIGAIIPVIQLIIGINYKGQCQIDQRIPTYMIVAGITGLVVMGLLVWMSISLLCIQSGSVGLVLLGSCTVCINCVVIFFIALFSFIWFIIGCIWVFQVAKRVEFDNKNDPNFCNPVLYKCAFIMLIFSLFMIAFQCCSLCCCRKTGNQNPV